jgi:hypothetical protein
MPCKINQMEYNGAADGDAGHQCGGLESWPRRDLPKAEWRVQLARGSPAR